jgi:hypothetical protein
MGREPLALTLPFCTFIVFAGVRPAPRGLRESL